MLISKDEKHLSPRTYLFIILASIITAFAFSLSPVAAIYTFKDIFHNLQDANIMRSLFCVFVIYLYNKAARMLTKRLAFYASLCGILLGLCMACGTSIKASGFLLNEAAVTVPSLVGFFIFVVGYGLFFSALIALLFKWLDHRSYDGNKEQTTALKSKIDSVFFSTLPRSFLITVGFLLLMWLPYTILCFPGLVSYDTILEVIQGLGFAPYGNHHPILHILFIEFFTKLGNLIFGSYLAGIAMASLFQMLCGAVIYAYALRCLRRWNLSFGFRIFALLFFALFPLIPVYNMTIWKDLWLAWSILLFLLLSIDIQMRTIDFSEKKHFVIAILIMFALVFSKNNGIIILVLSAVALVVLSKGIRIRIAASVLLVVVVFQVINGPVFDAIGIGKVDSKEALSIPLLQVARVVRDNPNGSSDEDKTLIKEVFPYDELAEQYNAEVSDSIKNLFDTTAFNQNKLQYFLLWLRLGVENPRLYVESFLEHTYGYWYPDVQYWKISVNSYPQYMKYVTSLGPDDPGAFPDFDPNVENYSIYFQEQLIGLGGCLMSGALSSFPLTSPFLSIGFCFWLLLVCLFFLLYRKRYTELTPIIILFALWFTCLLSPVYAELRYSLPAFVCAPIVIAFTFSGKPEPSKRLESFPRN